MIKENCKDDTTNHSKEDVKTNRTMQLIQKEVGAQKFKHIYNFNLSRDARTEPSRKRVIVMAVQYRQYVGNFSVPVFVLVASTVASTLQAKKHACKRMNFVRRTGSEV
jgi:hypothetical protein